MAAELNLDAGGQIDLKFGGTESPAIVTSLNYEHSHDGFSRVTVELVLMKTDRPLYRDTQRVVEEVQQRIQASRVLLDE